MMTTLHAGMKRTFQDMRGSDLGSPRRASKEALHHSIKSRECSATPTPPNGIHTAINGLEPLTRRVSFPTDASVLLIGVRGVGKSSLGFLAASAYTRRLLESDRAFSDATGSTRTAFRKHQGTAEYHRKHCEVLKRLLETNSKNCVIVCSFADLESDGAQIIQEFSQTHPVIYVTRDIPGIQAYIRVWTEERIEDLTRASEALLRECSNYEFFNVTETIDSSSRQSDGSRSQYSRCTNGPFLTLKRAEHDFLKLLRNIVGDHDRGRSHQSAYPLSQISVDKLEFTSAVTFTADDVVTRRFDLDDAQVGVDAIQLHISTSPRHGESWKLGKHSCFNLVNEAFAILRRSTILPIAIVVTRNDRPSKQVSRPELLEYCLRLGPDYCALDLILDDQHLKQLLSSKGGTKIIGEFLFSERVAAGWQSQQCLDIYRKGHSLGCDLVKIIMPRGTLADSFAIQAFQQRIREMYHDQGPGLIAYCTGMQGRTSMCFNNILTPVAPMNRLSESALLQIPAGSGSDAPLLTSKERNAALFASFVHEPMRFLIYGANVSFSLSPAMHNAAYEACGMPHTYRTHSASSLEDFVALVREPDFGGAAIVQPFKTKALPMMDVLSPQAKAIGALNTVIPLRDESIIKSVSTEVGIFRERNRTGEVKALYGDNTDWIGIRACIRRGLSPANTVRPQSTGLVCGAGGMARAAIYAMISLGVQNIFVCNRTRGNAEELAEHYNRLIRASAIVDLSPADVSSTSVVALESFNSPWPKEMRHPAMIVSCIPTQTTDGVPTNFVLPKEWLGSRTGGVVVEVSAV